MTSAFLEILQVTMKRQSSGSLPVTSYFAKVQKKSRIWQ